MIEFVNKYNIYFNFFSFGSLLVTVFVGFLAMLLLQIKQKSKSTIDLGLAFTWFSFFYLGYFIAAAIYSPEAANHRFLTVGFILPGFLQITQWSLRYPTDTHPRFRKWLLWIQWVVAIAIIVVFYVKTREVAIKFWPNGHYFDFDAETISKLVANFIMVYLFIFIFVSIWKAVLVKDKRSRSAIIGVLVSIVIGAMVPAILNTMSRDGAVDRSLYLNSLVLMSIFAFFGITVIFMNTTEDKTTFMAKIVGISMVTFLILFQGMAAISMEDRENEYDQVQLQYLIRAVEGGAIEPHMAYLYVHNSKTNTGELKYSHQNYFDSPSENRIDFKHAEIEYQNTALYEEIKRLDPAHLTDGLKRLFAKTPAEFGGYKQSLEQFTMSGEFQQNPTTEALFTEIERLNKIIFVNRSKLSFLSDATFRTEALKYINKSKDATFAPFGQLVKNEIEARTDLDGEDLKNKVFEFLAPFKPEYTRHYRFSRDGSQHFIAYIVYVPETQVIFEGGYFYREYRSFIHISAFKQIVLLAGVLFVLLILFPLFFRGSLINPLTELLDGVTKVNQGDLSVVVPVHVQDEIGFLAGSFNSMVKSIKDAQAKLQDYANNLEEMVKARTAELNASLDEVNKLKVQQDGDYYLTSLLMSPLQLNVNKSDRVQTNFKIIQKKKFEFRNKMADLGGDICITGNLRMGTKESYKRYLVAMNGDAMGKSMQGAGGALVMGVVMNSIMARSARHDRVLETTPEQWLEDVYEEINGVFMAFNGSMVISAVIDVIDEETGEMFYFNAEHPFQILYRNGKASFVEEDLQLRKLGLESEYPFEVKKFQLEPGDTLIIGSDGRDDIDLTPEEPVRTINEDEYLILGLVEKANANIPSIIAEIKSLGTITDDLSFLKIDYLPSESKTEHYGKSGEQDTDSTKPIVLIDDHDEYDDDAPAAVTPEYHRLVEEGRDLGKEGNWTEALSVLEKAYKIRQDDPVLNRTLAIATFREKDYEKTVDILEKYLAEFPQKEHFWLYLSMAHKQLGNLDRALEAAEKVFEINHNRVVNLLQLADLHFRMGHAGRSKIFLEQVFQFDPNNTQAKILEEKLAKQASH